HIAEYLAERPAVARIHAFDPDPAFVAMVKTKVEEMRLAKVSEVRLLSSEETRRLPWSDGAFDLVLAIGVVEHLPRRDRRRQVDEYYRVLAAGGHIAILDTPNRAFPLETHSVGLPLVQWLPAPVAYAYARALRRRRFAAVPYAAFVADGTGRGTEHLGEVRATAISWWGGPDGDVDHRREWVPVVAAWALIVAASAVWLALDRRPPEWYQANHLQRAVACAVDLGRGDWRT